MKPSEIIYEWARGCSVSLNYRALALWRKRNRHRGARTRLPLRIARPWRCGECTKHMPAAWRRAMIRRYWA